MCCLESTPDVLSEDQLSEMTTNVDILYTLNIIEAQTLSTKASRKQFIMEI